jgi:hypothetical protein
MTACRHHESDEECADCGEDAPITVGERIAALLRVLNGENPE